MIQISQKKAMELSKEEDLIFLCGHYEGIDERVLEEIVTDYISIGDYVENSVFTDPQAENGDLYSFPFPQSHSTWRRV